MTQTKWNTPFVYTHYGVTRTVNGLCNLTHMSLGLINPREFCEMTFDMHPHYKSWFGSTRFGWYWKMHNRSNDERIKNNWILRALFRIKLVIALPITFINCCMNRWMGYALKTPPPTIKEYMKRYFEMIRDGHYNIKERQYYI